MTKPNNQPDHHINAVLEPVAPGSRYDFIEIESNPILLRSPVGNLPRFVRRGMSLAKACMQIHWKIALIILVILLGAELALRSFEPRLVGRIYSNTHTGGHPIAMNPQGFRGDPVAIPKPENTTRILALGDSVTFGTGVDWHTAWPAQLENILRTNNQSRAIEVVNAALPALDLGQIELELAHRWAHLEPDQVVLMVTGNMVSFAYARREREAIQALNPKNRNQTPTNSTQSPKDRALKIYSSFALPGALTIGMEHLKFAVGLENHAVDPGFPTGVMLAHGYTQNGINQQTIDEAWVIFQNQLASLSAALDKIGIPLTVIYSPPRFTLSQSRIENLKWVDTDRLSTDPIERTASMCQELGIAFIDPRIPLTQATRPVYMLSDYTHFDTSGHHTIAQLIADSIAELNEGPGD